MRTRVTRPRRGLRHAVRGLRHAVRGPAADRAGPGARWLRRQRPLLVGPPLDTVLVHPSGPAVVHDQRLHLVVRPSLVVAGDRTSTHPVVRHLERVVVPSGTVTADRATPGGGAAPVALPGTRAPVLRHGPGRDERTGGAARRISAAPRAALALATPPRHLVTAQRGTTVPSAGAGAPTAPPAYSPARTPSYARPTATHRDAAPPVPGGARPAGPDTAPGRPGPTARTAPVDVDDLTRRVVAAIDRRLVSHRERMGRR